MERDVDQVCCRRVIGRAVSKTVIHPARLLTAASNDRDGWEMNALALDGNVYLEDHVTDEAIDRK